jgi:hypothetical protein
MARKKIDDNSESIEEEARRLGEERRKRDFKEVINCVLASPFKASGVVEEANSVKSVEALFKANTDVQTRVVLSMAREAMKGDVKAAEFLMKYSGREPPKEQNINMNLPQIVDDMTCRATPVVAAVIEDEEEEDES